MKKQFWLVGVLGLLSIVVNADDLLGTSLGGVDQAQQQNSNLSESQLRQNATRQIESIFLNNQKYMTFEDNTTLVPLPNYINTNLSTNWDFVIFNISDASKESADITINRVAIIVDGFRIGQPVDIKLKKGKVNKYYFGNDNLNKYIRQIGKGYTVFGVYNTIEADKFKGYSEYKLKPIQVMYSWTSSKDNNVNTTIQNMFVMMGKNK